METLTDPLSTAPSTRDFSTIHFECVELYYITIIESNMVEVECPTCGISAVIGLPNDATIKEVSQKGVEKTTEKIQKTRKVACPQQHDIYVTFTIENPPDVLKKI